MRTVNATTKGAITGLLMVAVGIQLYIEKLPPASLLYYIGYLIYAGGLVWTIKSIYTKTTVFGERFNQGFRCFIVVTLVMALYTFIFYKVNPSIIEKNIASAKAERLKMATDRTPVEIDREAETTKKYYIPILVSQTVFQYLLAGAAITLVTTGVLSLLKKNRT